MDGLLYGVVAVVVVALLFLVLYRSVYFFADFNRERRYLNSEISRTRGEERRHWRRQKRRLWLSLLPFFPYDE